MTTEGNTTDNTADAGTTDPSTTDPSSTDPSAAGSSTAGSAGSGTSGAAGEPTAPVSGNHATDGIPHGYTSLTPFLVVQPAAEAIDFYREVFGAKVLSRMPGAPLSDGTPTVSHAELDFGDGILQLGDPMDGMGLKPQDAEHVSGSICVYVQDVDAVVARAAERGAKVAEPPSNFVSGDRYASIMDPFNRRWSVMTRVEDLSREESEARVTAWLQQYLGAGES